MSVSPYRYVALLRAVNVGGKTLMKMADLRSQCEALGLSRVTTYIQSGNVIFASDETDPTALAQRIEAHLASALGYRGTVFVLTRAELAAAVENSPFGIRGAEDEQQGLLFLTREPEPSRQQALLALQGDEYRFVIRGKVLYFAYPRAVAGRRRMIDMEKVLGVTGTARTWNVVQRLLQLTD